MKAHQLIATPDKWTKGAYAKDGDGNMIDPDDPRAECWCVLGAIEKCYNDIDTENAMIDILADTLPNSIFHRSCNKISNWNDSAHRTHAEVLAKLKELDI